MSETSAGRETGGGRIPGHDFAIEYKTAISASIASLLSTTVGYLFVL